MEWLLGTQYYNFTIATCTTIYFLFNQFFLM